MCALVALVNIETQVREFQMKSQVALWIDHRDAKIVTLVVDPSGSGRTEGMVETVDKLADRQITAKVRDNFQA